MTALPISAGDNFLSDDKVSNHIDRFAKIHNDEQANKMEMERKGTEPKVIQPKENMEKVCSERPTQFSANEALNKKEFHRQTKNLRQMIRMDQQETGQAMLSPGQCYINQVEVSTSSVTKSMLL